MQGQGRGVLTWSVAVHWVHEVWGFPGGVGQSQPPPVLPGATQHVLPSYLQMSAICVGLGLLSERYRSYGLTD